MIYGNVRNVLNTHVLCKLSNCNEFLNLTFTNTVTKNDVSLSIHIRMYLRTCVREHVFPKVSHVVASHWYCLTGLFMLSCFVLTILINNSLVVRLSDGFFYLLHVGNTYRLKLTGNANFRR